MRERHDDISDGQLDEDLSRNRAQVLEGRVSEDNQAGAEDGEKGCHHNSCRERRYEAMVVHGQRIVGGTVRC